MCKNFAFSNIFENNLLKPLAIFSLPVTLFAFSLNWVGYSNPFFINLYLTLCKFISCSSCLILECRSNVFFLISQYRSQFIFVFLVFFLFFIYSVF